MSTSYPQYAKSPFPNELNSYITFVDVNASNKPYVDLYYQNFNSGDYESANQVLVNHPELKYVIFNADTIQMLFDNIMSTQAFVSSETFYEKLAGIVKGKGNFDATTQYELWNIVYYNGLGYQVTGKEGIKPPVGTLPTNTDYFTPISVVGMSGTGMSFYKQWLSGQNYVIADCVPFANRLYVCIQANNNKQPDVNPDSWQKIITIPQAIIWSKTQPEDQDEGNIWCEINDTDSSYITHVKQDDSSYKTYYPTSNANFIYLNNGESVQYYLDNKQPNYAGKLVVHVASSDSGSVGGTKVRIRNEQLGSNYVQTIDALGNTTFSLLDNHTYYVVLLDYPSSYYGAAATVTITGGETQTITITLSTVPDIIGWKMRQDTGVIEYTDGAVSWLPASMSTTFDYGSFANSWLVKNIKPCLLKNGVVQYYLNPNDYTKKVDGTDANITTGTDGNVMIEFPLIYYKFYEETDINNVVWTGCKFSFNPQDDTWCANAFLNINGVIQYTMYRAAYNGYVNNNILYSLSGKAPSNNITIGDFRTYATANGSGYQQQEWSKRVFLQSLFVMMFKSTDSQIALGKGVTSASAAINSGTMNDKGLFWGDQTGTNGVKFCGIENFWGNIDEFCDGLILLSYVYQYKIYGSYNDTASGYLTGSTAPSTGSYAKVMYSNNGEGLVSKTNDTSLSYYYDGFYLSSGTNICYTGGSWSSGTSAGIFYTDLYYTASRVGAYIDASLSFTPV